MKTNKQTKSNYASRSSSIDKKKKKKKKKRVNAKQISCQKNS